MEMITSNPVTVTVQGVQITADLTVSPVAITLGQSITLTVTTSGGTGSPIYTYYINGTSIGQGGSSITYTPTTAGSYSAYVYVVFSNGSVNSNSVTFTVNQPSVTYSVSVSPSASSNLQVSEDVTFTIDVTASDGSSVNGTATLYLANGSGTIWGQWNVSIANGTGSITLEPGLYLAAGYDTEYYYAIFEGYESQQGTLTFITSVAPTSISLSASASQVSAGAEITFDISTNGSNVSLTLYAYNSASNASNAPNLTGELGEYQVTIGASGSGSVTLIPTDLAPDTYWIAVYSSVESNIVEVAEEVVEPTYLNLSSSGGVTYTTFEVSANTGTDFTCYLYVYNSSSNASNAPPNGGYSTGQWGQWPVSVHNGFGSTILDPAAINTSTQYWIAVYETSSGTILRSNILTVQA